MNWFESLIYGLVFGISEFLPISSSAHQQILLKLFGQSAQDPLQDLLIHAALIAAIFYGGRNLIDQLRRQHQSRLHRQRTTLNSGNGLELLFLKNAVIPYMVVFLLFKYGVKFQINLALVAVFSLINGIVLFSQSRMMQGNKDERFMSVFDSLLIAIAGALSAFPGISRIGAVFTVLIARGVSRQKAVNWVILLSIPSLFLAIGIDILNIFTNIGAVNFPGNFFGYILSAIGAYGTGYLAIKLLKPISSQRDHSGFAYYSWGVALFSFIVYLTVV